MWNFPVSNKAGFDDDGSEFHGCIFLGKYVEYFPKTITSSPLHGAGDLLLQNRWGGGGVVNDILLPKGPFLSLWGSSSPTY